MPSIKRLLPHKTSFPVCSLFTWYAIKVKYTLTVSTSRDWHSIGNHQQKVKDAASFPLTLSHPAPLHLDFWHACCFKTMISNKELFTSLCNKSVLLKPNISWLSLFPAEDEEVYKPNLEKCFIFTTDLENRFCLNFLSLRLSGWSFQETHLQVMKKTIQKEPVEIFRIENHFRHSKRKPLRQTAS